MKKALTLFLLICLFSVYAYGQDTLLHRPSDSYRPSDPIREQKPPLKDRLFAGGDIGFQFGTITYIYIAPIIGYKVTEKFSLGGGPSYSYLNDKSNYYGTGSYTSNDYGGRVFGQYQVIPSAVAYAEYSMINSDVIDDVTFKPKRANIESFLVGGGYTQSAGGNSSFNLMVLFDVIQDRYSYYQNPIIRVGFNIGL